MRLSRREFTRQFSILLGLFAMNPLQVFGQLARPAGPSAVGNFQYIYSNPELRKAFLDFLINVFHLYPENELHQTILEITRQHDTDEAIYEELQKRMAFIKPFLAELRYSVPALFRQKTIMTGQTRQLLGDRKRFEGYLEIGSTGRYISRLENKLDIRGDIFLLHTEKPGYGPEDIVDREQVTQIGTFIDMGNYDTGFARIIPLHSLDIVTVYIGFHHCPVEKRQEFITSVCDVLKPKGQLILRDHDAHNDDMRRMAALAHDVFNAGTNRSWTYNQNELRNFYSLKYIIAYLEKLGLRHGGRVLFQNGDPTRNGLMVFTKA